MLFDGIILTCSSHIKEERTTNAIYYLLKGRKSIQTIQDAHNYQLEQFYGVYKSLNKENFDQKMEQLHHNNLLTISTHSNSIYNLTSSGKAWLEQNKVKIPYNYFSGLKYNEIGPTFLERLLLLIQVLTNSRAGFSSYIPVVENIAIENWIKVFYKKVKPNIVEQLQIMHDELHILLNYFPEREAGIFVDRLTGFKHYGLSAEQLANNYKISVHDVRLKLVGITHKMIDIITSGKCEFQFFPLLIQDLSTNNSLTSSATKTNLLIKEQYSIEKIARIRELKLNTVYDHIVEIALYDKKFPVRNYVNQKQQQEIMNAVKRTNSFKLKTIKDQVNEEINYFQIRLVFTMLTNSVEKTGDLNETSI